MAVTSGPGTRGTRHVATDYPNEEGLVLGTTKRSQDPALIPEEESLIESKDTIGL